MKLYYSTTSPYSRKVLILCHELEIADMVEVVQVNPFEDSSSLREVNPLSKVPTFVLDNGEPLYDSSVIAEYLQRLVNKPILSLADFVSQQRLHALADGIMDAAFSLVMEQRRPEEQRSPSWQQRWEGAISRSITEFEQKYIDHAQQWHIGSIAIACALDYLAFRIRENDWKEQHPKTKAWFQDKITKSIMIKTDPRQ
ncbi:glutathione S-transferase N-terminal domain-containing protein [Nostoc sp. CHAB 5834]|nr:glutathione S-transferase N-terminal domain-containing protein [Nostoc sp. CHAB 5834]